MREIKKANVAGSFYPENKGQLQEFIQNLFSRVRVIKNYPNARIFIIPHAGYIFSGPVAATSYQELKASNPEFKKALVLSPSHYYSMDFVAAPNFKSYLTPMGQIPVDQSMLRQIVNKGLCKYDDHPFEQEHALEVHLPFLQVLQPKFELVPLIVGQVTPEVVEEIIECALQETKTVVVISSDLSHFDNYESANKKDQRTAQLITDLQISKLQGEMACGHYPLKGALLYAQKHGLRVDCVDLRNSGDTAGDKARVVGYGGFVIHE